MGSYRNLSIVEIEKKEGTYSEPIVCDISSPLSIWHEKVRLKKIRNLSLLDLARCLRQDVYVEYIIPEVLHRLWRDPMSGDIPGEIVNALLRIDDSFWREHSNLKEYTSELVNAILDGQITSPDYQLEEWIVDEFFSDVRKLKNKLQ